MKHTATLNQFFFKCIVFFWAKNSQKHNLTTIGGWPKIPFVFWGLDINWHIGCVQEWPLPSIEWLNRRRILSKTWYSIHSERPAIKEMVRDVNYPKNPQKNNRNKTQQTNIKSCQKMTKSYKVNLYHLGRRLWTQHGLKGGLFPASGSVAFFKSSATLPWVFPVYYSEWREATRLKFGDNMRKLDDCQMRVSNALPLLKRLNKTARGTLDIFSCILAPPALKGHFRMKEVAQPAAAASTAT